MQYLTDEQMKREKPLKNVRSKKNNALEKFLNQSGQFNMTPRRINNVRGMSVYYVPRKNQVIILD
ncbi:MAG: hypothetical protein ABSF32_00215 [Ignavibacteria bacterium]|jgi:hypothetical protein